MSNEGAELPEVEPVGEAPVASPPRRRKWKWLAILLGIFVAIPAAVFGIWVWIAMSYTYSSGDRAGYVQKFSEKGWLCKTWEGELSMVNIPGAAQERWNFSVRDDSVAALIRSSMGNKVSLIYEEHPGVPSSCFGDTQYFVTGLRRVPEP